jgi:nickel/cobalt exporter
VLVLAFALTQGLFWVGAATATAMGIGTSITVAVFDTIAVSARSSAAKLAASRSHNGALVMRGIELGGAVLMFVFGVLLLAGYRASERLLGLC